MIDIGANIGTHTIPIAISNKIAGVYSFEACPDNVTCLAKNCKTHDLSSNRVIICPIGLSNKDDIIPFYQVPTRRGASSFDSTGLDPQTVNLIKVTCQPLDNFLSTFENKKHRIDFIKIDVQNYEYQVLLGAIEVIKKYHPAILVECPARNNYEKKEYTKIYKLLGKLHYREVKRYNKDLLFIYHLKPIIN